MSDAHRFGLSTCWNAGRHSRPNDLLDDHERKVIGDVFERVQTKLRADS